jgi:primosomal protein N' (replication factor Y)
MAIAKVEPLTTARALRGPFDYRIPDRLAGVGVGDVLLVPFGPRRVLGVVVGLAEKSELAPERLAEPISALEAGASPELVRLGLWAAREYCSTPARGLELVLPPGVGASGKGVSARRELRAAITDAGREQLSSGRLGPVQRAALELLAQTGESSGGELADAGADRAALRRLEKRGFVTTRDLEIERRPRVASIGAPAHRVELTAPQRAAAETIIAGFDGGPTTHLLHGVTGSGKTEVYLAAAETALERGMGVIALVPEIGLTPQALARFRHRLGDTVAILHSGLTPGERRDEWMRLRSGEARVCVGPRSAVWAPVPALGLVIVDEEHDSSYKQESDPRYDARDVALRRASESGAVFVAGSATPRPESWVALERLELPERVDGRALPRVQVVDMRERHGEAGPFHGVTRDAIAATLAGGSKAIVLVSRRGWSPFFECRSCGHSWRCPNCDVSLVLHRSNEGLRCHHCGHAEPVPGACAECGSVTLARHGAGSERIEAELRKLAGDAPVLRLDSDTTTRAGAHAEVLERFDAAGPAVLVGTQMVAKGHDFPEVTLSVVVDADASLRFPDFRSEERAFSLVAQLAGRSGRGERGGGVIVQTLAPDANAIQAAARHDSAGFLAAELERRRALSYPPFAHLVRVELTAADAAAADTAANGMHEILSPAVPLGAALLGPAPRFRLRGRERRQLLVKAPERAPAVSAVRAAVDEMVAKRRLRGVSLSVDVDPQ